jgi:hypothetical protein
MEEVIMLVLLLALLVPSALRASDLARASSSADAVLARYTAGLTQANQGGCGTVAVEIEAALPKRAERGRVLAVRHSAQGCKPEYKVLRSEGDRSVKQQVIARYLSATAQASASAVAITPANYKFRHIGSVESAGTFAYVFEITPRKKRVGLIKGQLWIDASTGIAVREYGRLVKSPSVFLRRVEVMRDTSIRNGVPYLQTTHLEIETRLIGQAELTVKESPVPDQSAQLRCPL